MTIEKHLDNNGAKDQLVMFLSGKAGSGKSHVIESVQIFLKVFCDNCDIPFDDDIIKITACTGSAASLFMSGKTIHGAAFLRNKRIVKNHCNWVNVILLFIDEISFMSLQSLAQLDTNLRALTGNKRQPFGGIHIIFIGDFRQIPPVKAKNDSFYSKYNVLWDMLNAVIFLENNHRFKDDPGWGEILERISLGTATSEDFEMINSRVIGANDKELSRLSELENACYACTRNIQRNSIATKIFSQHVINTHIADSDPPNHTIIIESKMEKKKSRKSSCFHETIYNSCGDADVVTSMKSSSEVVQKYSSYDQ